MKFDTVIMRLIQELDRATNGFANAVDFQDIKRIDFANVRKAFFQLLRILAVVGCVVGKNPIVSGRFKVVELQIE